MTSPLADEQVAELSQAWKSLNEIAQHINDDQGEAP